MSPSFPLFQPTVEHLTITCRHAQLLDHTRLLLVVLDRSGNLLILSDALAGIDGAIKRERYRILNRDKIGQDFLLAFDESKRTLAVCASQKVWYHERGVIVLADAGLSFNFTYSSLMKHIAPCKLLAVL